MRRALKDLKIILLANLWTVPVFAALVGALFYFVAPPPPIMRTWPPASRVAVIASLPSS